MPVKCGSCNTVFELNKHNSKRNLYEAGEDFNWLSATCPSCQTVHHLFINPRQSGELDKIGVKSIFKKLPNEDVMSTFTAAIGSYPVVIDGVVIGFLNQLTEEAMQQVP